MKKYEILKDFKGSPDGFTVIEFKKGQDDVELNDELAKVALDEKWVKPSKAAAQRAKEEEARHKAEAEAARIAAEEQAAAQRAAAIAELQDKITQLKADYEAATNDDDKARIVAEAAAKQAELDALLAE